ncbi:MAG: DUF1638 domain-containing protein [Eggerthellaceae bacterium]|nr:DUF1638 domain-containing protein [Eggerthellaceae bacterium]
MGNVIDSSAGSTPVREVMIACTTLRTEIEHVMDVHGITRPVIWLENQLHIVPAKLKSELQNALSSVQDADRVLLGYGNCGNVVPGLESGDFELIVPRLDDCISLMLGSQFYRQWFSDEHKAFYLTDGWTGGKSTIDHEFASMYEDYGEEEANEVMAMMYAHYSTMAYLDTGLYDIAGLMQETAHLCEVIGVKQVIEPATLAYVEQLVCGPWPEELFVRVGPHEMIEADPFMQPGSVR